MEMFNGAVERVVLWADNKREFLAVLWACKYGLEGGQA